MILKLQFQYLFLVTFRQKLTIYRLHPDDSGKYFCSVNGIVTAAWLEVTREYEKERVAVLAFFISRKFTIAIVFVLVRTPF